MTPWWLRHPDDEPPAEPDPDTPAVEVVEVETVEPEPVPPDEPEPPAEPGEPAHDGDAASHSVWFTWTAPADGPVTFSSCGSDHDTVLAVYTGSALGGLTRLAGDDDTCELGARTGVLATAGTTYRIALDGFHGAGGTATLTWD